VAVCTRLGGRSNGKRSAGIGGGADLPTLDTTCTGPGCRVLAFTRRFTHNELGWIVCSSACLFGHDVILEDFGRDYGFGPGVIRGTGFFHL